jgi:hypothetical protein
MTTWLYTRINDELSDAAKASLKPGEFHEVLVDNPVTEIGLKAGLRSEIALTPILVKQIEEGKDGYEVYHWAVVEGEKDGKFVRILAKG